jgi:hypothetical protein
VLRTLALYLHPVTAFAVVGLAVHAARLGLAGRSPRPDAAARRARHARLTPRLYGLIIVTWVIGVASVRWGRDDLDTAASGHFLVGTAIVGLFTAAAAVSRFIAVDGRARAVHPLLGAAALVLCGVQIFLGLQIMPH